MQTDHAGRRSFLTGLVLFAGATSLARRARAQAATEGSGLSEAAKAALQRKRAAREKVAASPSRSMPQLEMVPFDARIGTSVYDSFGAGTFNSIENIRLRWLTLKDAGAPDYFALVPHAATPFSFQRPNGGAVIAPRHMFTDGGSVPWVAQFVTNLSPWGYGPAYLVHDWLFDLHHCGQTDLSFESVRDVMMEAIKTLMETGICPKSEWTFWALYQGISSDKAREYWDTDTGGCTLPPDLQE